MPRPSWTDTPFALDEDSHLLLSALKFRRDPPYGGILLPDFLFEGTNPTARALRDFLRDVSLLMRPEAIDTGPSTG